MDRSRLVFGMAFHYGQIACVCGDRLDGDQYAAIPDRWIVDAVRAGMVVEASPDSAPPLAESADAQTVSPLGGTESAGPPQERRRSRRRD